MKTTGKVEGMSITPAHYVAAEKAIRSNCPQRAFPHIPDNCWVDSTMFGLTYSPDIGRVLRAALLGCLENLRASNISTVSALYTHVKQWQLEPVWNTYITRMLLYFLLEEKAEDHLTCPLIRGWVEDFRKKTLRNAKYTESFIEKSRGGITQSAIFAILTSLSISTDIITERVIHTVGKPVEIHYYTGDTMKYVGNAVNTTGYERRVGHYTVKSAAAGVGHVIVGFLCEGDFYLYDNNFGLQTLKNMDVLPETIAINYKKHRKSRGGPWYAHAVRYEVKFPTRVQSIQLSFPKRGAIEEAEQVETQNETFFLYTRQFYNRVRRGEDILAKMQGAPRPKRLTAVATPHIADLLPQQPQQLPQQQPPFSLLETPATVELEEESEETNDTGRISKFATCIRQIAATVPYKRSMQLNAPGEPADALTLSRMSSKFTTLLNTIRALDERDQREHGVLFKHFIFTDLRDAKVGAKAIASFLQAHGWEVIVKAEKGFQRRKVRREGKIVLGVDGKPVYQMIPTKKLKINLAPLPAIAGGSDRVGLVQGNPLWKSPLGVEVRKRMLSIFNSRPDNIHGEQIRIMILDSKFKEGIDLYDVRYVHLMEPQITEADLKQAVGRATRFCGQRGLQFVPHVGWNLDVYLYETQFGTVYPFVAEGDKKVFDAHAYMMAHSGMDLGLLELTRNLTVLAIKSAVDYDLTYKINNFKKQSEILDKTDLQEALVLAVGQTGDVRVVPIEQVDIQKCGARSNKFFPFSVAAIQRALRARGVRIPAKAKRLDLCKMVEEKPEVVQDLLKSRMAPARTAVGTAETSRNAVGTQSISGTIADPAETAVEERFPTPKEAIESLGELPDLADFFRAHELAFEAEYAARHASFGEFQAFIREKYTAYGWEAPVVENGCESIPKPGQPVVFSRSQDFVRHYLTPASPFRGLLAWHSVGTGKTCTAVATATTTFQKEGYSILWVTRNSLMADVWKNMFGAVCSIPLQDRIAAGKPLPAKGAKRLVGKSWFDPISYRTFQNAVVPMKKGRVNQLGKLLQERNGSADPLRRTFLIIDEVHKLMDGDLKPSEAADFDKIVGAIQNSYKVSGADSVRVLFMTATPITDNPAGLFRLLNALIPEASRRFPAFEEFRKEYTTPAGTMTAEGEAYFQQRAKGLISYLNREFDPSTFAQPQFHSVPVPASGALLATDVELVSRCLEEEEGEEDLECDVGDLKHQLEAELADLAEQDLPRKELADRKRTLKASYKGRIAACKAAESTRKQRIHLCLKVAAKTRKEEWRWSQQKAVKTCFGKKVPGKPMEWTSITELKRMAEDLRRRKTRKNTGTTVESVDTTRATRGPIPPF